MSVVSCSYKVSLSQVDKYVEAHIEFLKKHYALNHFITSGRKVPRTGGIILADVATREALNVILQEDPFYQADVADYQITEFVPTMAAQSIEHVFC